MRLFRLTSALAAAFVLSVAPVLAQTAQTASPPPAAMPEMPAGQNGTVAKQTPADRDMMAGMTKMSQTMSGASMTGDPDKDFVMMMMPHHQGAIDMAQVELKYGKDPAMRRMANDILAAQKREIGEMRRWQAKHPAQ